MNKGMAKKVMARMGWVVLISLLLLVSSDARTHSSMLASGVLLTLGGLVGASISTFSQKRRSFRKKQHAMILPIPSKWECQEVSSPGAFVRVLRFVPNATTVEQKCINSLAWRQLGPTVMSRPSLLSGGSKPLPS